jgi:cytochrome P450
MNPDALVFVDPQAYADPARWHAATARLRASDPLPLVEADGFRPFRAVTRHAHVEEIERNHDRFHNTMDSVLATIGETAQRAQMPIIKTLIHMDGREHREHRKVTNDWFKPAELRRNVERTLPVLARRWVDRMMELGDACDFARDIALYYPLRVIMTILGVPEEDEARMLQLTQELFGAEDPDVSRGAEHAEVVLRVLMEMGA